MAKPNKTKSIAVRVDDATYEQLKAKADRNERSISAEVRLMIKLDLQRSL